MARFGSALPPPRSQPHYRDPCRCSSVCRKSARLAPAPIPLDWRSVIRKSSRRLTANLPPVCATRCKNDPKPSKNGSGRPPASKEVLSLFSLCYLVLEKSSKSLILLSDCPFVLNRLPAFLGISPCFRGKTGMPELSDHGPEVRRTCSAGKAGSRVRSTTAKTDGLRGVMNVELLG